MTRITLATIGALALVWQVGRTAAEPGPIDTFKKLPEVKSTAVLTTSAPGSAPASVKEGPPALAPRAVAAAPAPALAAPAPVASTLTGFGSACCDLCSSACTGCCSSGHLIGGVGLYIVQPYFENNPAFTVTRISPDGTDTHVDRTDLRHHVDVAPELWLGYIGENGLGGRLRWWYFRQGTDQALSAPAAADPTIRLESASPLGFSAFTDNDDQAASISVTSKLQVQVWDLEAIQSIQAGCWDLLLSGGLRLAHINQNYNAFVKGDSGGDPKNPPIAAAVLSGHSFDGVGPVIALDARRPFADTGFAFFGTLRGALLFGSAKQSVTDVFRPEGDPAEFAFGQDHRDRVLPVAELELGMEYARKFGQSRAFAQIALVGQEWWGGGNASRSTQTNDFGLPNGGAIIDNDFGFFGLALRLGVDY